MSDIETKERPILVAVDFSPHSAAALDWAVRTASALDAPLDILHVVHDPESEPGYYREVEPSAPVGRIEEAARRRMDRFLAEARERGSDVESTRARLVRGIPVNRILEAAAAADAQLIVMGSQGRTGLPHLMLGSKAERVAQLSNVPVTIVKTPR